jgi:hypothetical protein
MGWFPLGEDLSLVDLGNKLLAVARSVEWGGIELMSPKRERFGINGDVPVSVLQRNKVLNLLHTELLIFLAQKGSVPKELQWVGASYRPHVTCAERLLPPGCGYVSRQLVLVERGQEKAKLVRGVYPLGR